MSIEHRATYRLQVHAGFTLNDAAGLVDYLSALGISHVYTSPILQAAPGSTHGYDVVNHTQVNTELGGPRALDRLTEALRQANMGYVLDIVPNHMAINVTAPGPGTSDAGLGNPWWWDVLENGPSSRYATYFDVEWNPAETRHENQVLVPILGDHYGCVIENGEIRLAFDGEHFTVRYYDHSYPVDPRSLRSVLAAAAEDARSDVLAFLADAYGRLPSALATDRSSAQRRNRNQAVLGGLIHRLCLEQPAVRGAIDGAVSALNQEPDALDAFLSNQNYRLAFWRITQGELGYRRFFDINTLIGLRIEDEQVCRDTHALIFQWLNEGRIDGLRIDHPDGLRDPAGYFQRLSQAGPGAWIVLEKILEVGESLPPTWPVAGTTGYDFLNRVNGLLVDTDGEAPLTAFYAQFTGEPTDYAEIVRDKKHFVMREILGSDVARLTSLFRQVCANHRRHRDYTEGELRDCLCEVAACLPIYRTYVQPNANAGPQTEIGRGEVEGRDQYYIKLAIEVARTHRPDLSADLFDFFRDLLLLRVQDEAAGEFVARFQQFTGPVMAKGVEDTTFYVFNRLVSLNEVGGDPGHFGLSLDAFHQGTAQIQEQWPWTMLASSTHDTKRSEDVRARLNVISEIPECWANVVERWAGHNQPYKQNSYPDRNTEYLLYQTLVGAWPVEVERTLQYMEKACREAKVHTSWTDQNQEYEAAVAAFVRSIYEDQEFTADLAQFVAEIVEPGWINALAQTLIKLTAPGVPDIYQGSELWDFSLVDPDNRRPVDYSLRRRLLAELTDLTPEAIWERAAEGLPKLWVICQALALRRQRPDLFGPQSSYRPLPVNGVPNVVAFARNDALATVVPRLTVRHGRNWNGGTVEIPGGQWHNQLTGNTIGGGAVPISSLLARFPVCLLVKTAGN